MEKRSYSLRQIIAIRHKLAAKKAAAAPADVAAETPAKPKRVYTEAQKKAMIAKKIAKRQAVQIAA